MNGKEFVKLCFNEKESVLKEYFSQNTCTEVGEKVNSLIKNGASRNDLYKLIDSVLNETYYSILLALDGEASLGGIQINYKIFDDKQNLLNECGEIEEAAFKYFMEE